MADWLRTLIFLELKLACHLTAAGSSQARVTWEKPSSACGWTGGFSWGSLIFTPPNDWLNSKLVKLNVSWRTKKKNIQKWAWQAAWVFISELEDPCTRIDASIFGLGAQTAIIVRIGIFSQNLRARPKIWGLQATEPLIMPIPDVGSWVVYMWHNKIRSEPEHDKNQQNDPAKTQISLGIHLVWSEALLSAWRRPWSLTTLTVHSEDPDQTGWMRTLIWVFTVRTVHFVDFVRHWLKCYSHTAHCLSGHMVNHLLRENRKSIPKFLVVKNFSKM